MANDAENDEVKTYCTEDEVSSMFGDNISDDIPEGLLEVAIENSTTWIESNLKKNYVPIPSGNPHTLRTVAIYHSASDILLSLYQGADDMPIQFDVWFNKAQSLLDDYIEEYWNGEAEGADMVNHQMVKHSHARTYNQKRHRRSVQRWGR